MKTNYQVVVQDLKEGNLKWQNVSNEKVKNIEKQVTWQQKLKQEVKDGLKKLEKEIGNAEHDLENVAKKAINKIGNLFGKP